MTRKRDDLLNYVLQPEEETAYRLAGQALGALSVKARIRKMSLVSGIEPTSVTEDVEVKLAGEAACCLCLAVGPSALRRGAAREKLTKVMVGLARGKLEFEAQILSRERLELFLRGLWWGAVRLCVSKQEHISQLALRLLEQREVDGKSARAMLRQSRLSLRQEVRRSHR